MFQTFVNVSVLDICWLRAWREVTLPGPLFPSIISLRLGGCMTREFVACLLKPPSLSSTYHQQILYLDLNNLFQWSRVEPPLLNFDHLRDAAIYLEKHQGDGIIQAERKSMVGHLDSLVGQLTALKGLRIGTIGLVQDVSQDPHPDLLYASWARLLNSVRGSLQSFHFDQGFNRNDEGRDRGSRPGRPRTDHRAMDSKFLKYILPVLLEAPWPCLKRLRIYGVGRKTHHYDSPARPTEEELKEPGTHWTVDEVWRGGDVQYAIKKTNIAIPPRVREHLKDLLRNEKVAETELVIAEEQGRDWEYLHFGDTGIPQIAI
jgi:hypothetical protein